MTGSEKRSLKCAYCQGELYQAIDGHMRHKDGGLSVDECREVKETWNL